NATRTAATMMLRERMPPPVAFSTRVRAGRSPSARQREPRRAAERSEGPARPLLKTCSRWWHGGDTWKSASERLCFDCFGVGDLDAEAGETDIGHLAGRQQTNRGDAEVAQDLRAEADLAPLLGSRSLRSGVA